MGEMVMRDLSRNFHVNNRSGMNRPIDSKRKKKLEMHCCRCFHKRRITFLTCVAICLLVLIYNILGGFIFLVTESPKSYVHVTMYNGNGGQTMSDAVRLKTVERLWTITEDLNILYKQNWTKLADEELLDFQKFVLDSIQNEGADQQKGNRWTFAESFFYALTLITTIGNGNIRPTLLLGTTVTIVYAALGIPIIIFYLSIFGEILSRKIRALYFKLSTQRVRSQNFHSKVDCITNCRCHTIQDTNKVIDCNEISEKRANPFKAALNSNGLNGEYHWLCPDHTKVPIIISIFLFTLYVVIGAFIFNITEDWSFVDALYFSFSVLATIGFGYLKPGAYASSISTKAEDFAIGACCLYIHIGILVVAVCFNLINDDMSQLLRGITSLCMGNPKSAAVYDTQNGSDISHTPVI